MAIMIPRAQLKDRITTLQGKIAGGTATSPNAQNTLNRLQNRFQNRFGRTIPAANTQVSTNPVGSPVIDPNSMQSAKGQEVAGNPQITNPTFGPGVSGNPQITGSVATTGTPAASMTPSTASNGAVNTLFPSSRIFEPENYTGSPLYKFQLQAEQDQLAKSLAAKGLTNSGKAITDEVNVAGRVAAQDTDRIMRQAESNADRLYNIQNNEALRLERGENNQWNRAFSLAELMAAQSPWTAAISGLNNTADTKNAAGAAQANFLKDFYQRVIASGGGGGGGGSSFVPAPLPSGPNFSNISPTNSGINYSSNAGWLDLLGQGIGSLFPSLATPKAK